MIMGYDLGKGKFKFILIVWVISICIELRIFAVRLTGHGYLYP